MESEVDKAAQGAKFAQMSSARISLRMRRPSGRACGIYDIVKRRSIRVWDLAKQFAEIPITISRSFRRSRVLQTLVRMTHERRNDLEIVKDRAKALHDPTRIDLLFTMSEITRFAILVRTTKRGTMFSRTVDLADRQSNHLVEPDGIEPTTSCLQSTRSPS